MEHEDKCKRCGQCCRIKTTILGVVFYSNKYCPYLVFEKDGIAVCTIYKERYEKAKWCKPVEDAVKEGLVPNDCAYTPEGYESKIRGKVDLKNLKANGINWGKDRTIKLIKNLEEKEELY